MEAVAQMSQLPAMPAPSLSGELVKAQCLQNIIYLFIFNIYLFIWLCHILAAAHGLSVVAFRLFSSCGVPA